MAARNLSQTDLANKIGVAQGTISRAIYDRRRFDLDMLRRLAETFDTPYGEVLALAGYADLAGVEPEQPAPEPEDALLTKLRMLLDRSTPVPPDKLATLRTVLDGVITPYWEQYMTRRRRTG
jgi:transcriptional regulator with XRE-family HTH domain